MTEIKEILLALLLLSDLSLVVSSRLLHCIRLVTLQGLIIGLFPLAFCIDNHRSNLTFTVLFVALITIAVKAILLPIMLRRSMIKAHVRRELEPLIGYSASLFIVIVIATGAFFLNRRLLSLPPGIPILCIPAALTTLFTGLFIIVSRRKALTQALGFLVFENGITIFGLGMMLEHGILVELGILLDVLVLVFVMGITIFNINREFSNIDSDHLHLLSDNTPNGGDK